MLRGHVLNFYFSLFCCFLRVFPPIPVQSSLKVYWWSSSSKYQDVVCLTYLNPEGSPIYRTLSKVMFHRSKPSADHWRITLLRLLLWSLIIRLNRSRIHFHQVKLKTLLRSRLTASPFFFWLYTDIMKCLNTSAASLVDLPLWKPS